MATRADGLRRTRLVTQGLAAASVAGVVVVGAVVAQQHRASGTSGTSPSGTSPSSVSHQEGDDNGSFTRSGDDGSQQVQQAPVQPAPQGSSHHAITSGS